MLTAQEINEYKKKRETMPLAEIIAESDCGHNCPPWFPDGCGCKNCAANKGFFTQGEFEYRNFSDTDIEQIEFLLSRPQGCLGENGCELPRRLRSEQCLRAYCNPLAEPAGNWSKENG